EEAISVGVDLYRAMPSSITALDLAELYESMGDLAGVLDWVEEALALEPHSPRARSLQVRALLHLGDVEAGAELAQRWWAEDPHNVELALSLAEVALAEGRLEEADALSDHAVEQLPGSMWARALRADVDWALGRSDDAIVVMQDLLADNRGDLRIRLRLGLMLLDVNRNAEAVRTLRPAAWMAPDDEEVLVLVASAEEALALERSRRAR
ncbi:MAG: Tetratricopeptide repeat, partial [Pseudomonadota bacterium]